MKTWKELKLFFKNKICIMFADITLVAILLADPLFPLTSELGFQFSVHALKTNMLI